MYRDFRKLGEAGKARRRRVALRHHWQAIIPRPRARAFLSRRSMCC